MTGFGVLLGKELREQWRTMRLVVVGVFFLVFGIVSPLTARYTPELIKSFGGSQFSGVTIATPTIADAVAQFVKNVGGTASLAAILLAMGLVAAEKERGTAGFVLTRPADRGAFVLAKMAAVATTLFLAMALAGIGAYAYTAMLFAVPSPLGWAAMCLFLWLGQLVLAAITLLASTALRSTAMAGGIGFLAYIALSILGALPALGAFTPQGLNAPATAVALGQPVVDLLQPLAGTVALVLVPVAAAWLTFRNQEL